MININVINFQNTCSNWHSDIIITNESSTSVLVQWRHYTMNSDDEILYNITYSGTPASGSVISQTVSYIFNAYTCFDNLFFC